MSNEKHLYPHEIIKPWQEAVENLDLPTEEARIIMAIVQYSQPPPSLDSLIKAAELYSHDQGTSIDDDIIRKFERSDDISQIKPKSFGTSHPVFYAFTLPTKLGKFKCCTTQRTRELLSELFHDAKRRGNVSANRFYEHFIAARDVMIVLMKTGWETDQTEKINKNKLLISLRGDHMYGYATDQIKEKIYTFEKIVRGELLPGGIKYKRTGGRVGSGSNDEKHDIWHEERIAKLAQLTKKTPNKTRITASDNVGNDSNESTELLNIGMEINQRHTAGKEADRDVGEALYLQQPTLNTLTLSDSRESVRHWLAGAPTSSIKTVTDMGRLTPDLVKQAMEIPLSSLCRIFASLLISTGLPPKRLTQLSAIRNHTLEHIIHRGDNRPYWLPNLRLLCYQLTDGPTKNDANPAAKWVILHLPKSVASELDDADKDIKNRPFYGVQSELNRQLKKFFTATPGIIPTTNRLSATSWLYCRPYAVDDIAAAMLSGNFGLGMAAPAAYREVPRQEHQKIFENTLRELGWHVPETIGAPLNAATTDNLDLSTAGSAVARPSNEFSAIFEQLKHAMKSPSAQLSRWWPGEPIPLAAVIELYQLVSAYELLAWQLSTGARPIGPGSKNYLGNSLQWIYDKNSSIGRESRVIPLLASIRNSLISLHNWTSSILHRLNQKGVNVKDQRKGDRKTPGWMEISRRGNSIKVRDMMWQDLATLTAIDVAIWPPNVCRHSTATWLRQHAPDAQVDHLLGHTRFGRMLASTQAETPLGQQHDLRKLLTTWLKQCGYRPLHWNQMPWK